MRNSFSGIFDDSAQSLGAKVAGIYMLLVVTNVGAWGWALVVFGRHPVMLGTSVLAYSLGLRHAVDADHIAAIDNVTRKLMQKGSRPISAGFFFSIGHSTVVILATIGIATAVTTFKLEEVHFIGSTVGTLVSAFFLFAIGASNIVILLGIFRTFRRMRYSGLYVAEDLEELLANRGPLFQVLRPIFALVSRSWQMYPLGFLFGLGFDTATEIGLLSISAAEGTRGISICSILVFPALFTAGMSLIDATDNILMIGVYSWAFVKPVRKLYYNMMITIVAALVALLVGAIETLGLIQHRLDLKGKFWNGIFALNTNFSMIGYLTIAVFVASWVLAVVIYRIRGYDRIGGRINL
jgi:nickel/cobalt transporter (NiCoT) family protein